MLWNGATFAYFTSVSNTTYDLSLRFMYIYNQQIEYVAWEYTVGLTYPQRTLERK